MSSALIESHVHVSQNGMDVVAVASLAKWLNVGTTAAPTPLVPLPPVPDFVPPEWAQEYHIGRLAELALDCALYIEAHGWTQSIYEDDRGRVCAMGALMKILRKVHPDAYAPTCDRISHAALAVVGYHVPTWNDAPERTADEVIDMWLEVATIFEARALATA